MLRCSEPSLALRLTRLLLATLLAALTRILGLLAGFVLPALAALLATLIRVVLLMLAFFAFGRHCEAPDFNPCPPPQRRPQDSRSVAIHTKV